MSNEVSTVDIPPPLYPTLDTNSDSTNTLPSSQSGYVSLLDSRETPGEIFLKKIFYLNRLGFFCFVDGPVLSLPQRATLGWS